MPATTRQQLLREGVRATDIDRARRRHELRPWTRGIYPLDDDWGSLADAHLLRGGPGSALSHRSAVRLHDLDVRHQHYEGVDLLVPPTSSFRGPAAVRCRTLASRDVVLVDGHWVTSKARTLLDLGAKCSVDEVELALESAVRGDDPMTPWIWDEELFAEIVERAATWRGPGGAAIRAVLARRPTGVRPTGSAAETVALQALRFHGFGHLLRQPTVTVIDEVLGRRGTWYPDLFDVLSWSGPEIDGSKGHSSLEMRRRDARRDNVLGDFIRITRTPANDVLDDPAAFGRTTAAMMLLRRREVVLPPNVMVTIDGNNITIRRTHVGASNLRLAG